VCINMNSDTMLLYLLNDIYGILQYNNTKNGILIILYSLLELQDALNKFRNLLMMKNNGRNDNDYLYIFFF
jgi:hypothetical protein